MIISSAVLAVVVIFTVMRDDIGGDTLNSLSSRFSRGGDEAEAAQITFDEGRGTIFALYDGRLAALSPDRFVLYDRAGRERTSRAVSFEVPALTVAGGTVIAYDRGGGTALIADTGGIKEEHDLSVLTAAANARGQYILVTNESGYRGVARLYDNRSRPTFEWYSAERYILAASVSPSGRRMAVAAVGQRNETVSARITFLEPGRTEPLGTADIGGEIPLAAYSPDNNHVCILTESGVYFYSDEGSLLGHFAFGTQRLLSVHSTDQALFLHIGRNEGGQHSRLICLSYTGTELGRIQFTEGPDALAAEGRWCASIEAGVLTRYFIDGAELKTEPSVPSGARGLLLSPNGGILLLYSDYAKWYNERTE
jgi:hypothetical protein